MEFFSQSTYWKFLKPKDKVIEDPTDGTNFHAPTVDNNEVKMVKQRNYVEVFDRKPFVGAVEVPSINRFKRRCYDSITKKLITNPKPIGEHGQPNPEFLSEHGLDSTSMPHEWFNAFLPRSLTSQWNSFTNHKSLLYNAGQEGKVYPDYTPFTND